MDKAVLALIIMAIAIILFILELFPSATTAICGCIAMVAAGVCDVDTVVSGLTNNLVLIIFGMSIIGSAMQHSGAADLVGRNILKISHNNERLLIIELCLIAAIMSAFMNSTIVSAMMLTVCMGAASANPSINLKNLSIPVIIATIMGGTCTIIGAAPQIFASGYFAQQGGPELNFGVTTPIGIPLTLTGILYFALAGYPLGKRIWGKTSPDLVSDARPPRTGEPFHQKAFIKVLAVLALVVILSITKVCSVGSAAVLGGMLCILTGTLTQKQAFHELNWNTMFWMAGCMGMTAALESSGANKLTADILRRNLSGGVHPWVLLAAITFFAMAIGVFIADATTVVIILPIVMSSLSAAGLSPIPYALGVIFGASIGFATPLSNGFLGMAMSSGYRFKDYVYYGLPISLVSYVVCVTLIPVFYPLTV